MADFLLFLLAMASGSSLETSAAAQTIRRIPAIEARQGVAAGQGSIYAVANSTIARYDRNTGAFLAKWEGHPDRYPHINSCTLINANLVCAASNYPAVPHASSVEFFDPITLEHKHTISLGGGTGSITWVDWRDGHWWAMFANYDAKGGEPPRDHRHTMLVKFDNSWRRTESWMLPASVLGRIAPMSISGGSFRENGDLWLSGHDLPELYVVRLPKGGATLDHVATVKMEAKGQAIDWDESQPDILWGIQRGSRELLEMRVPAISD